MRTYCLLAFTILLLSSCATLINTPYEAVSIVTSEPTTIALGRDTLPRLAYRHYRMVERSWDSLQISAFNSHHSKTVKVKSHNSPAYWLNLYPYSLWFGFLVDRHNPKRYSYPYVVYMDMNQPGNDYLTYIPLDPAYAKYNNILKINPLKAISPINSGVEISLEKRLNKSFTTQVSGTYLFPNTVWRGREGIDQQIKGFQAGIEQRYYLNKSAPLGPYVALDFSFLKTRFREEREFVDDDSFVDTMYYDYETYSDTFGIKKQTYTLNLKYGYQYVNKHLTVDLYVGLGLRRKNVVHFDRLNPEDVRPWSHSPDIYMISNDEGKYWTVSLPLGFRIGWTF